MNFSLEVARMSGSSLLNGLLAGLIATAPMTATMVGLRQLLPQHKQTPLPPSQITAQVMDEAGLDEHTSSQEHGVLTNLAHYGFGAIAGGVYALLASRLPVPPALRGVGFGLLVWAGNYQGWLPAVGLLPPASESPAHRNMVMIAAHLVWGLATGLLVQFLEQRD